MADNSEPLYYTRLKDFKVGMEIDNRYVGRCKVIEVRREKERIKDSRGNPIIYSCRGWVAVEYVGCQLDGSNEKMYQRCDAVVGISETDTPFKYTFNHSFREIGFGDEPWPEHVDSIRFIDSVRPGEFCSHPSCRKKKLVAVDIDSRDGSPICEDCWEDLMND
jgi:hypothetical protein